MNTQQIIQKITESGKPLTGCSLGINDKTSYISLAGKDMNLTPTNLEAGFFNTNGEKIEGTMTELMNKNQPFFRVYEDKSADEWIIASYLQ